MAFFKLTVVAALMASVAAFAPNTSSKPFGTRSSTELSAKKFKQALKYVPVITKEQAPKPGSATSGVAGGLAICVACSPTGQLYALGDKCPPVNQPLSFGKVNKDTIEDPVLGTKFSLKTGEVVDWCPAGKENLLVDFSNLLEFPLTLSRAQEKNIEVQVDVNYKLNFEAEYWSGVLDAQGKANGKYY
eukprot:CAMPEP_0113305570 /NCGR_PEP_ID=MMETSP0010_2-20120614/5145_1 /TAXON_ID=216773 ORGANISM="Corethron hystrix, Strain 308" /NCGR_SAMPLE_ID=MMETSP0010_2 /ASSEMBLY_ACC=CAM_ASM_000155 /LENGTH=187 /DNA_ID=CAMNT_0000160017 /DNA_START=422 /DNA_END=986 /DNA_ORIENTATION=- /assembly_acc=CAM_ASM_000155